MNAFRTELKRAVQQRFKRVDLDRFKIELKEHVTHFLFEHTGRSPIVIPVINVIGGKGGGNGAGAPAKTQAGQAVTVPSEPPTPEQVAAEQQRRFEEMRARLLGQDQQD